MNMKEYWNKLADIVKAHPKGKPFDKNGMFYPDPTPVAPPVNFSNVADIDMFERMRNMIRQEMSNAAGEAGFETFEEADDFDVDDEHEPFSPYEMIVGAGLDGSDPFKGVPDDLEPASSEVPKPKPPQPQEPDPPSDGPDPSAASGRKSGKSA